MGKSEFIEELYNHIVLCGSTAKEISLRLEKIKEKCPQKTIVISKKDFLNAKKFNYMCSLLKDQKVLIRTNANEVFSEKELEMAKNSLSIAQKYNVNAQFENGFTFDQAQKASSQIDTWINEIKNAKVNGEPLSEYEKYLMAYQIATKFVYKEEELMENPWHSRDLNHILTDGKIVCTGFSGLLKCLCNGVGIDCEMEDVTILDKEYPDEYVKHAACCVRIKDGKYGIDGVFYSDPTNDSKKRYYGQVLNLELVPYKNVPTMFGEYDEVIISKKEILGEERFVREKVQEKALCFAPVHDIVSFSESYVKIVNKYARNELFENIKNVITLSSGKSDVTKLGLNKEIKQMLAFDQFSKQLLNEIKVNKKTSTKEVIINFSKQYVNKNKDEISKVCKELSNKYGIGKEELLKAIESATKEIEIFPKMLVFEIDHLMEKYHTFLINKTQKTEAVSLETKIKAMNNVLLAQGLSKEEATKQVSKQIVMSAKYAVKNGYYGYAPYVKMYKEMSKQNEKLTEKEFYTALMEHTIKVINQNTDRSL